MNKENNCRCVVCQVEQSLLDSLSTQTARNHFKALASNYPVLNHFTSPIALVSHLHEQGDAVNHNAGSEILQAVIHAITERPFEEIGQQLLLLAFTPVIHKTCCEILQRFPTLPLEEIAQQGWLLFLETTRSPEMLSQNGLLLLRLVSRFRQSLFRWAMQETRPSPVLENLSTNTPEPLSDENFEDSVLLKDFFEQARSAGLLSTAQYKLLLRFKGEGLVWKELGDGEDGPSAIALYRRVKRTIYRLRRARSHEGALKSKASVSGVDLSRAKPQKKFGKRRSISPSRCAFSNSEKGFSPELPRPIPQVEADVT